ncbi:MAG: TIR domain-containing protein [Chlorobiales bacterium]|nr:TIR domain-containing protein [Chlorobiales bacterium]
MEPTPSPDDQRHLDERQWRNLLRDIHAGQVLPVIGPELVTVTSSEGEQISLHSYLAVELAHRLGVTLQKDELPTLNAITCSWVLSGQPCKAIYDEIRDLVDNLDVQPPKALLDLTSISDFELFICTAFDPLTSQALQKNYPGFLHEQNSLDFHPNNPRDIPEQPPKPFLFHILGTHNTYPDFVVWEEDYIEYMCGLLEKQDNLRLLFDKFRNKDLLLIGSPFHDWIVRFFLRVAKGKRFSEPGSQGRVDYLAEKPENIAKPTIFFYQKEIGSTRIIPGNPSDFASELARQWNALYSLAGEGDPLQSMSDELPRGSVFISYSHKDLDAVLELTKGLMMAQIPVWLDKERLSAGENFERTLEQAVKNDASFFISVISHNTESDPNSYVHKERTWAAQRHVDGFVYYIPVLIEDLAQVKQEAPQFAAIHRELLPQGTVTTDFVRRMQHLIEEYRISGHPRG